MVEFLLTKGADINLTTRGELQTPVHFAAKNDAVASMQVLLNFGADQTCKDYKGRTPLQVYLSVVIFIAYFLCGVIVTVLVASLLSLLLLLL